MSKRITAMVLVHKPELTQSVWQDFFSQHRTRKNLERRLRLGVKQGEWAAWRLIRIEKEVMGHE